MSDSEQARPIIVVRRRKSGGGGHHGGAWKVAYADFVTAMMAFFLVMWLVGAGTKQQKAAISEYFKNPSMTQGAAMQPPEGATKGPGGATDSLIEMPATSLGTPRNTPAARRADGKTAIAPDEAEKAAREAERKRLEALKSELQAAIQNSQALKPFKDQLLLDLTPEGMRIQIVDEQNRAMFDTGSARLKPYTAAILHELARFINAVPNSISISGHTDDAQYNAPSGFSNWELSTDRANAARRALVDGGMRGDKVARVVGLAATVPFDRARPQAAINRRISIVVMTRAAAAAALSPEAGGTAGKAQASPSQSAPAPH